MLTVSLWQWVIQGPFLLHPMEPHGPRGQRKRLEMARAMAIEPKLLLMDEVTGGVDQKTIPGLVELIKKLKKSGVTIVTIEHNINIIMEISDNVLALDQGKSIAFGSPKEIQNNKQVIDSYLGTFDAA